MRGDFIFTVFADLGEREGDYRSFVARTRHKIVNKIRSLIR